MENRLFSNEIVFRGHPDKVCDQISNAILDAYLSKDKNSRVGVEVVGGKGVIFITGEVTSNAQVDINYITKRVLDDIGYTTEYQIIDNIGKQSLDIAQGVDTGGAGDQGMMFGYACNDTPQHLPKAQVILQEFAMWYDVIRKTVANFKPDGKAQITGRYDSDFNLISVETFLVSYNNDEEDRERTDEIITLGITGILNNHGLKAKKILINPTGKFLVGGFEGDAGLTGRKIVVDAYQGFANVGGGSLNGKDPSKVDLSGAYKAREIAVRYLKRHDLKWCEVQLSYAIGVEQPMAIYIFSDKGYIEPDKGLYEECKPKNIINDLKLLEVKYEDKAKFGHFVE